MIERRWWWCLCFWVVACNERPAVMVANFSAPTGVAMALVGNQSRLFVANAGSDALRVIQLANPLSKLSLTDAPNGYFPLFIPMPAWPNQLQTSWDHQYIVGHSAMAGQLSVINANSLRHVLDSDGNWLLMTLPMAGDGRDMVMAPSSWACAEAPGQTCLGRILLSLGQSAQLWVVDLLQNSQAQLSFALIDTIDLPSYPDKLAVHPTLPWVYVGLPQVEQVVRVDVSGSLPLARYNVGDEMGPLTVLADGNVLAVGRIGAQDVMFLQNLTDSPYFLQIDDNRAPLPACLPPCSEPQWCEQAGVFDQTVCVEPQGLRALQPGWGLALPGIPSQLLAVPAEVAGQAALQPECDTQATGPLLLVGTLQGDVVQVYWQANGQPSLRLGSPCNAAQLTLRSQAAGLAQLLAPCPQAAGLARFACLGATASDTGQVLLQRGALHGQLSTSLAWEGVLPGLAREGGSVVDGMLVDPALSPNDLRLQAVALGDVLAFTKGVSQSSDCAQWVGSCLEVQITAMRGYPSGGVAFSTTPSLSSTCFVDNGNVGYEIRAHQAFWVNSATATQTFAGVRLAPGQMYGLGSMSNPPPVLWALQQNLAIAGNVNGCLLYNKEGELQSQYGQNPLLSRRGVYSMWVEDTSTVYSFTQPLSPAALQPKAAVYGVLPGSLLITPMSANGAALGVGSFTGSNVLWLEDLSMLGVSRSKVIR